MNSTLTIILKNSDTTDHIWGGYTYAFDSETQIEDVDRLRLLSDSSFIESLLSGLATISDGDYVLRPRIALGLLQNNQVILNEYYTLVQDDDILIGNGKILHLHDDRWEIEDDFSEEDNPTEE